MTVESEATGTQTAEETGSTLIGQADASENEQLAEAGEFDQLLGSVNSNLAELGMQEDSVELVGALTKIANAGNPQWRTWACKMLNWHNGMAKFMKGL